MPLQRQHLALRPPAVRVLDGDGEPEIGAQVFPHGVVLVTLEEP